jgi:hypothetical protein
MIFKEYLGLWISLHIAHHHYVEITIVFFGVKLEDLMHFDWCPISSENCKRQTAMETQPILGPQQQAAEQIVSMGLIIDRPIQICSWIIRLIGQWVINRLLMIFFDYWLFIHYCESFSCQAILLPANPPGS